MRLLAVVALVPFWCVTTWINPPFLRLCRSLERRLSYACRGTKYVYLSANGSICPLHIVREAMISSAALDTHPHPVAIKTFAVYNPSFRRIVTVTNDGCSVSCLSPTTFATNNNQLMPNSKIATTHSYPISHTQIIAYHTNLRHRACPLVYSPISKFDFKRIWGWNPQSHYSS